MGNEIPNIPDINNGVRHIDFIQVNKSGTGVRILPQQIINQVLCHLSLLVIIAKLFVILVTFRIIDTSLTLYQNQQLAIAA